MLARGNENFRAPGEHGFSFFHVKMFTGSVSVLLTSTSLKINGDALAAFDLKWGVAQGSCLGPVLFTIYKQDLFSKC